MKRTKLAKESTRPDGGPMFEASPTTARTGEPVSAVVSVAPEPVSEAPKPTGRVWSVYQTAIYADIAEGDDHTVIRARAGTGKTSTLVEGFKYVPKGKTVLMVAFNKKIKEELLSRQAAGELPGAVDINTFHGFGFAACRSAFRSQLVQDKTFDICMRMLPEREQKDLRTALLKAVAFAKGCLASTEDEVRSMLDGMLNDGQIEWTWGDEEERFISAVLTVLAECRESPEIVDFDDMVYLAVACKTRIRQYDFVFIDELQDLNRAQRKLALMACKKGGRIIAVGDNKQAIYAFRGADSNSMDQLIEELEAKVLPLSVTYRCASSIVDVAKQIVPDYEAAPGAERGEVLDVDLEYLKAHAGPGDFVISRANAPLLGLCLAFLKAGKPASIAGRDVGASLRSLIEKSKASTTVELTRWLDDWRGNEIERLSKRERPSESAIEAVLDKVESISALSEGAKSVPEVLAKIESLFSDKDDYGRIVCSSCHRSKGLERDRVWLLADTFRAGKNEEEANLWYVAVTRARKSLMLVSK
jgi:DNA helicase-2/ATP-dependent DNA helicase PcrA